MRILRDVADAEDVVHDVFVQARTQCLRDESAHGGAAVWLLTTTRSRAIDRLRARRGTEQVRGPREVDRLTASETVDLKDPHIVRQAVALLPVDLRRTLELAYFEGYTPVEIAAILEQPLDTVKTRILHALWHLRNAIRPRETSAREPPQ